MTSDELTALRREKDQFFKASPQSPLSLDQQDAFTGLSYYEPNPALELVVPVEPLPPDDNEIVIETTTGDKRHYRRYGRFHFEVDGQDARIDDLRCAARLFPAVCGRQSRERNLCRRALPRAGRAGGRPVSLDFNLAYNPYCAYGDGWSCPITPAENRLKVAIRAGEKNPAGKWVGIS